MNRRLTVVGDKFIGFAKNDDVVTLTQIVHDITCDEIPDYCDEIYLAQGISYTEKNKLENLLLSSALEVRISYLNGLDRKENLVFVHKIQEQNVVIAKPEKLGEGHYQSYLLIDNNCEIMADHVTGMHLQGMLIIEAGRQMMLSIIENYFPKPSKDFLYRFTLESKSIKFNKFLFPIDVSIESFLTINSRKNGNLRATLVNKFQQNNINCAEVSIDFSVYKESFVLKKETELVEELLSTFHK